MPYAMPLFMIFYPAAVRSRPTVEVRRCCEIVNTEDDRRAKSNVIARPGKTNVLEPGAYSSALSGARPAGLGEKSPSEDLRFPKRKSPFRQLRDESGELRRCPFIHMQEDVVLRFVRLLEELVLDIRILFRTRALRDQGVS